MMKLYQKKSASLEDETVLVQLGRRHTLKEDTNEADSDNLRKTIRANSLGSFGEGSSTDIEAVTAEKQSNFTRKPTVITENELSSSWLYKDRKAKINSDDESVEEPRPTMPQEDHEDLEPKTLHDPKLKPAPVSNRRPRKVSSCCWYFTIILVICIACLSVMAGVGGIVYMEFFAIYKEKDIANTNTSVKNDNPSASEEIFQHPTHKQENFHRNEPKIPENILKDIINNFTILAENTDVSRKVTEATSQPNDIFHNNDQTDSKNSKAKELNNIKSSFVSENQDLEMTEHPKTAEHSDVSRNIHGIDDIMDKTPDGHVDKVNEQMTGNGSSVTEKSNSKAGVLDSREETLVSERNFNFDLMTALQGVELKGERENADILFQNLPQLHILPDNSLDHMEKSINDHEDNSFDYMEKLINDHEDNSLHHMEKSINDHEDNSLDYMEKSINDHEDNSLDHRKHGIDHSPKNNSLDHIDHSIDPNDKSLSDHNEDSSDSDSDDSSSEEHSLVDDQNQNSDDSTQLVFIRPIVESKAIPVPLAFLRRIGFDIKNPNSHQPMTAKDMDIKFSLAEALKYLRSLDTGSKLPVSREKTISQKTSNQEESKKTKLPIKSEREEYLNLLRKQIFEESS
ncbi:hypothetical protein AVEN_818-1 [Araneus ventricosus]|uniref:Uncharacterized protein n=1 Tax=Araneus ventricosus TaxID=182803 RepID=A0A4Y2K4X3_ARAVE|nr:hypothetical protein AVEN_818-1 [Araneus ventricosus]